MWSHLVHKVRQEIRQLCCCSHQPATQHSQHFSSLINLLILYSKRDIVEISGLQLPSQLGRRPNLGNAKRAVSTASFIVFFLGGDPFLSLQHVLHQWVVGVAQSVSLISLSLQLSTAYSPIPGFSWSICQKVNHSLLRILFAFAGILQYCLPDCNCTTLLHIPGYNWITTLLSFNETCARSIPVIWGWHAQPTTVLLHGGEQMCESLLWHLAAKAGMLSRCKYKIMTH